LKVRIREADRHTFRFHRIRDIDSSLVETLRFTRALFGLVQSKFLLEGTLKQPLEALRIEYPKHVEKMISLYVDDTITWEDTVDQLYELKGTAIEIFKGTDFKLPKWNSNVPQLEADNRLTEGYQTNAKEQLGVKTTKEKLLGLPCDKVEETLAVTFSGDSKKARETEREKF